MLICLCIASAVSSCNSLEVYPISHESPAISQKPDFCAVSGHRNEISPNFSLQVFKLLRKKKTLQNSVIKFGTDSSLPVYLPTYLQYCLHLKTAEYPSNICIFISGRKMTNGFCFFFSCYTAFLKNLLCDW